MNKKQGNPERVASEPALMDDLAAPDPALAAKVDGRRAESDGRKMRKT